MRRPFWISLIGAIVLAMGVYLSAMAVVLMAMPRAVPVLRRFPLLHGLRFASPYFSLLVGVVWCWIGWGLLELRNWARVTAAALLGIGVVWELLPILQNRVHSGWRELAMILEIALRSAAAVYLMSLDVVDLFEQNRSTKPL
jgi:hypothetical protein